MRSAKSILRERGGSPSERNPLHPYVRSGLTLVVGPEGSGKSTWLASLAVAVASGQCPPWAKNVRQGPVLWLTGEEEERTVAEGLIGLPGVDGNLLERIQIETASHPDLPKLIMQIEEFEPVLIIADPVDVLAPPQQGPRRTLEPLLRVVRAKAIGVVAVVHTLHGARRGQKLVKGAGDWTRLARSVLYYGSDPRPDLVDEERRASILYHFKINRGGERGEAQEFDKDGWAATLPGLDLEELLRKPDPKPPVERGLERAVNLILKLLAEGPQPAAFMEAQAEASGISRATLYRAAEALGVVKARRRGPDGTYGPSMWSMPGEDRHEDEGGPDDGGPDDNGPDDPGPDDGEGPDGDDAGEAGPERVANPFPDPADLAALFLEEQRQRILLSWGLDESATPDEIKRRWRELARQHHPDLGGDTATAARLNALYRRLLELEDELGRGAA